MPVSVSIQGTLHAALGLGPVVGSIQITNPSFSAEDGTFYPATTRTIPLSHSGAYSFSLAPTDTATPAGTFYTAHYSLHGGQVFTEQWEVPTVPTGTILTIPQIRLAKAPPAPNYLVNTNQIYNANASLGDVLMWSGTSYVPVTLRGVFPFTFNNQTQVIIPGASHQQGSALFLQIYDAAGDLLDPSVNVDPVLGNVTITFGSSTSGFGFVYGGLGRSLPNYSHYFAGVTSVTIPQSQHGFGTNQLAVSVYDSVGNLISSSASVNVSGTNDVTVAFSQPTSCTVVIAGCLGTGVVGAAAPSVNPTAAVTLTIGLIADGTIVNSLGVVSVPGAVVGNPVVATCSSLPPGVQIVGKVTGANQVELEAWNISGANVTLGASVINITVLQNPLSSGQTLLTGTNTITVGSILDGSMQQVGTVPVTGAAVGDLAFLATSPALASGLQAVAKVTGTGVCSIEIWNLSGQTQTPGSTVFTATVLS